MGQEDIRRFLKQHGGWCTIQTIVHNLNIRQSNVNKSINQLHKRGTVIIVVDGKRHLIKTCEEQK